MCASAIQQSRIENVYYALPCENVTTRKITEEIFLNTNINKIVHCQQNICDNESLELLQTFFQKKRKEKNDIK